MLIKLLLRFPDMADAYAFRVLNLALQRRNLKSWVSRYSSSRGFGVNLKNLTREQGE